MSGVSNHVNIQMCTTKKHRMILYNACALRCNTCNIYIHQYCCECPDSILQTTICKHIHLVVRVVKTGQSSTQRTHHSTQRTHHSTQRTHHSTQEDNDNILSEVKNQSIPSRVNNGRESIQLPYTASKMSMSSREAIL